MEKIHIYIYISMRRLIYDEIQESHILLWIVDWEEVIHMVMDCSQSHVFPKTIRKPSTKRQVTAPSCCCARRTRSSLHSCAGAMAWLCDRLCERPC